MTKAIMDYEAKGLSEMPAIEKRVQDMLKADSSPEGRIKAQEYLTQYTGDFSRAAMQKWIEMGDAFWALFARGF